MQKLVISWVSGSEECCCDNTVCVLYESAEAFYCDFEEIITKCKKASEDAMSKMKEYSTKLKAILKIKNKEIMEDECKKLIRPGFYPNYIEFVNRNWNFYNFFEGNTFIPPKIQTLDEWFEEQSQLYD